MKLEHGQIRDDLIRIAQRGAQLGNNGGTQ